MTRTAALAGCLIGLSLGGCGGARSDGSTAGPGDPPAADRLPPTDDDPPPPAHAVRSSAGTGEGPVALRLGGAVRRAMDVAVTLLGAMLRADRGTLESLLAPTITRVRPRFGPEISRNDLISGVQRWAAARARRYQRPPESVEEAFDLSGIEVHPVAELFPTRPRQSRIDGGDYAVVIPVRPPTGRPFDRLQIPGWGTSAVVVVRVAGSPVVLGF